MNMKGISTSGKPTQYETVEDAKDLRIPVQSEEAFEHGITFKCKYVGTEEIPRPNSRVEIVAAMRRIRYEHKYRNIKKRKVSMDISADGIKITLRKKKKKNYSFDEASLFIMHYPVNRVFYVSHDSQDLKILSYIARGEDGLFRCSVFKALKKAQAMHIVRTIGQAFEVCHKINLEREKVNNNTSTDGDVTNNTVQSSTNDKQSNESDEKGPNPDETDIDDIEESDIDSPMIRTAGETVELQRPNSTLVTDIDLANHMKNLPPPLIPTNQKEGMPFLVNGDLASQKVGPFTIHQLQQLYHQQLLQQMQECEHARTEASRLREQVKIETDARIKAQNQINRLLAQNRELVGNLQRIMSQLHDKHQKEFPESFNETWMLSDLSSSATILTSSMYQQDSTGGLGSTHIDFNSQIFNNTNVGPSPRHHTVNLNNTLNNKLSLSFEDIASRSFYSDTNHVNEASRDKNKNPFTPKHNAQQGDAYRFTFDTTLNSTKQSTDSDKNAASMKLSNASPNQSNETAIS